MYEAEVNDAKEAIDTLPSEVRARFAEYRSHVIARTVLPWGEHCTECVWPTCYKTCELYSPRVDGACRQFVDGMVRIDHADGLSPYLLKLRFKNWAKLWTVGNLRLHSMTGAAALERLNIMTGAMARNVPAPAGFKPRILTKLNYLRRRAAESASASDLAPDCFMVECYNPNPRTIDLSLTVRSVGNSARAFQSRIQTPHGYTRARVPMAEISRLIDLAEPFEIELVPNNGTDATLYFGLMDFVAERAVPADTGASQTTAAKWKCIVWDLDNTLWDGILVEDGPDRIRLRSDVVRVIKETDERGILHSIASKNNLDDVMSILGSHGLTEYFLYPQVSWQPKSAGIARIAAALNIGIDSLVFVDDQRFEQEEVKAALPHVTVIDAQEYSSIPDRPECQVPVTQESRNRRKMYREQESRDVMLRDYGGDYIRFLRDCQLEARVRPLDEHNLKRVYELAQRTNQMNFSGNRYPEAQLRDIISSDQFDTYVIDCTDRFGDYGIVGFALVDLQGPRLLDLMFSCRVQAKRVEHAILTYLLKRHTDRNTRDFFADYRKTAKNAPSGQVFEQLGFEPVAELNGVTSLVFRAGRDLPDEGIVTIRDERSPSR